MAGGPDLLSPADVRRIIRSGQPAMLEFYSPTCPHCAALEPTLEKLADAWNGRVMIGQVDLLDHPEVAREWTILGTPTVLFFARGQEVARLTGVQSERQYERELRQLIEDV